MASSPPTTPSSPPRPDSSQLYYAIVSIAVVAALLLLYNAIAVGCCSQLCPIWARRMMSLRFPGRGGAAAAAGAIYRPDSRITQLIPVYKYRKEEEEEGRERECGGGQCSVCISAFADGEDVRRLPKCRHSFHAACIDMWLYSHASCPLCRASVSALAAARPSIPAAAAAQDVMDEARVIVPIL